MNYDEIVSILKMDMPQKETAREIFISSLRPNTVSVYNATPVGFDNAMRTGEIAKECGVSSKDVSSILFNLMKIASYIKRIQIDNKNYKYYRDESY